MAGFSVGHLSTYFKSLRCLYSARNYVEGHISYIAQQRHRIIIRRYTNQNTKETILKLFENVFLF